MIAAFRNWRFAAVLLALMALLCVALITPNTALPPKLKTTLIMAAPVPMAATSSRQSADIWTATRGLTAAQNATAHFRKHNRDFHFRNVGEYIKAATTFLHTPPKDTQTKREDDGDVLRFRASTGEFAVMRKDGTPRTYFKLDPDIHGYPTNQAYFDAQ